MKLYQPRGMRTVVADATSRRVMRVSGDDSESSPENRCRANQSDGCTRASDRITLLTAGVPCQPVSCAGKRRGAADDRWLWPQALRVVSEVHPDWCVFENPTGLNSMELQNSDADMEGEALGIAATLWVRKELERLGYSVGAVVIPACAVNAIHRRDRIFLIAHSEEVSREWNGRAWNGRTGFEDSPNADTNNMRPQGRDKLRECAGQCTTRPSSASQQEPGQSESRLRSVDARLSRRVAGYPDWAGGNWQAPPPLAQSSKGRVNKLKALGNAVVPWQCLPILQAIAALSGEK